MANWRLPPDDWLRAQPEDRSQLDRYVEYYRLHPEHRLSLELRIRLREQLRQLPRLRPPKSPAEQRVREARSGDPTGLIYQLRSGDTLDPIEIDYLAELAERAAGESYQSKLRAIERFLVVSEVEHRLPEFNGKLEAAMAAVGEDRGISRATIERMRKSAKEQHDQNELHGIEEFLAAVDVACAVAETADTAAFSASKSDLQKP